MSTGSTLRQATPYGVECAFRSLGALFEGLDECLRSLPDGLAPVAATYLEGARGNLIHAREALRKAVDPDDGTRWRIRVERGAFTEQVGDGSPLSSREADRDEPIGYKRPDLGASLMLSALCWRVLLPSMLGFISRREPTGPALGRRRMHWSVRSTGGGRFLALAIAIYEVRSIATSQARWPSWVGGAYLRRLWCSPRPLPFGATAPIRCAPPSAYASRHRVRVPFQRALSAALFRDVSILEPPPGDVELGPWSSV